MKNELLVIKIGGNVLNDAKTLQNLLQTIATLHQPIVLVHGGGKKATTLCEQLSITTTFVEGRRITDLNSLEVAVMVYAGLINKQIVANLQALQKNAIGVCGADMNLLQAQKRPVINEIDYGYVGDIVESFNVNAWTYLLSKNVMPVVAPITHDNNGQLLNTNADTIAQSIAIGLSTNYNVRLIYLFEKPGVLLDADNDTAIIKKITPNSLLNLITDKIVTDGMIPKLENAVKALQSGLLSVSIGHANDVVDIINEKAGTCITNE